MKKIAFLLLTATLYDGPTHAQTYQSQAVPFNQVSINDSFWRSRLKAHSNQTLQVCIAQMEDSTKRISNFEKAAALT